MPNHVTTVCEVTGIASDVAMFIEAHIADRDDGEGKWFDLATVIPKPACVAGTEAGNEAEAGFFALTGLHKVEFAMFLESPMHLAARHQGFEMGRLTTVEDYRVWLEKKNPGAIEKGRKQLACFRETGFMNWYDWSIANWGTKWGAYDYEERSRAPEAFVFKFETAWSFPVPIFEALATRYPLLTFKVSTVDEGGPHYVRGARAAIREGAGDA